MNHNNHLILDHHQRNQQLDITLIMFDITSRNKTLVFFPAGVVPAVCPGPCTGPGVKCTSDAAGTTAVCFCNAGYTLQGGNTCTGRSMLINLNIGGCI